MAGSGTAHLRDTDDVVLRVEHLVMEYPVGRHLKVHAVSDVSFDVLRGETLGLVGESGCGKSTVGKAIIQFPPPSSGSIMFEGKELTTLKGQELRYARSKLQMIFQDPISSLNPRRKVKDIVGEGLDIWKPKDGRNRDDIVNETMQAVGLDPEQVQGRRPHEFSGGQCQRISIARSLAIEPEMIICDEPVASLDVSVQAQILNLLEDMKEKYGLTLIFIAHDLAVVKMISDRIIVMYLGKTCEVGPADTLYNEPLHPYTRALLDAVPLPDPEAEIRQTSAKGDLPSPINPPSGCRFRTRCPRAETVCAEQEPQLRELVPDHFVACHFPLTEDHVHVTMTDKGAVTEIDPASGAADLGIEVATGEDAPSVGSVDNNGASPVADASTETVVEPETAVVEAEAAAPAATSRKRAPRSRK